MAQKGLIPTPTSTDYKGRGAGSFDRHAGLDNYVKLVPTPTKTDGRRGAEDIAHRKDRNSKSGVTLNDFVAACPTPSANDWKGSSKGGQRRGQLTDPDMGVIPAGGTLNPTWVEWLMGFPPGWTDLNASETP